MSRISPGSGKHTLLPTGPESDDLSHVDLEVNALPANAAEEDQADPLRGRRMEPMSIQTTEQHRSKLPGWYRKPVVLMTAGFLVFFVALIILWAVLKQERSSGVSYTLFKSSHDPRDYRYFILSANSLPVLLISDPATQKCAASMSVQFGSSFDPPDRFGLAHFLEHMLFLGSKDFPKEDGYNEFLTARGGYSNAYTAEEETNFYFNMQADGQQVDPRSGQTVGNLEAILPQFAGFFTSPLLSPSGAYREMNAVNAEHEKNILNDDWRGYEILHRVARNGSAFSHFGTGTLATLNHTDIVDRLRTFWETYYRAQFMKLVILGKEPLDELQRMATTYFSAVPGVTLDTDGNSQQDSATLDPYSPAAVSLVNFAAGSMDGVTRRGVSTDSLVPSARGSVSFDSDPSSIPNALDTINPTIPFATSSVLLNVSWIPAGSPVHTLSLYFPLPSCRTPVEKRIRNDPFGYLSYELGHEGDLKTLCSTLKSMSLVQSISVGLTVESNYFDQSLLGIEMKLTTQGNSWANRPIIIGKVFQYVKLLTDQFTTDPSVHEAAFQNYIAESELRFQYKAKEEPSDYVKALASRMGALLQTGFPVGEILLPPNQTYSYNTAAVTEILAQIKPENMIVVWASSDLNDGNAATAERPLWIDTSPAASPQWQTDPWYGTRYLVAALAHVEIAAINSAAAEPTAMAMPPAKNPFMPTDFALQPFQTTYAAAQAALAVPAEERTEAQIAMIQTATDMFGPYDPASDVPIKLPLTATTNELLFKPDYNSTFNVPKAYFSMFLRFPPEFLIGLRENQVRFQMYLTCLGEIWNSILNQLGAVDLGLSIELHPAQVGFALHVSGFSSSLPAVLQYMQPRIWDMSLLSIERFQVLKQNLLQNAYEAYPTGQQPYRHALDLETLWLSKSKFRWQDLQAALADPAIDRDAIQTFVDLLYSKLGVTCYAYGQLNATVARNMYESFVTYMRSEKTSSAGVKSTFLLAELTEDDKNSIAARNNAETYKLTPPAPGMVVSYAYNKTSLNPVERNSALVYTLQISTFALNDDALSQLVMVALLDQFISPAAFHQLRTVDKLGYMVWAQMRNAVGATSEAQVRQYNFIVQSPTTDPVSIEQRVENFINVFLDETLKSLSDEDLETQRATLKQNLQEAAKGTQSLADNFSAVWNGKIWRDLDVGTWNREQRMIALLEKVTRQSLLDFYNEKFLNPQTRLKFCVRIFGVQFDPTQVQSDLTDVLLPDEQTRDDARRGWATWY
jgi:insulysin